MVKTMRLALCAAIACTAACSTNTVASDQPSVAGPGKASSSTSDRCRALLPDDVFTALGRATNAAAVEHAGRCLRRAEGAGAMTVGTRAVTESGPDSSRAGLDAECDELRERGGYVDQPVAWLASETDDGCFASLAVAGTGVAELYFINSVDELVQVRLESLRPLEPEVVEQAMTEVAAVASELGP